MSANSATQIESSSLKKRKTKAAVGPASSTPGTASPPNEVTAPIQTPTVNGLDGPTDSPYLKEISKNIRNIHKKLAASSKADAVVAENPNLSLEELVTAKKINADQKAQVMKKPGLQNQLAQLEEQLKQYRSFAQELEERHTQEKASLNAAHEVQIAQAKESSIAEAQTAHSRSLEDGLLVISQFLHAAAAKRQSEEADSEERRAFEGALLLVYQGNDASLSTLRNLIQGTNDKVPNVQGDLLNFTFAQIKESATQAASTLTEGDDDAVDETDPATGNGAEEKEHVGRVTDPTVAHATLNELADTATMQEITNGSHSNEELVAPEQTSTATDAANAVAESSWDPQASMTTDAAGEEWVQVPRDPAETDAGLSATPAAMHNATSWAEEVGAAVEEKAAPENDGFEQVRRDRGPGRGSRGGRGSQGGQGRGSDGRGRGRGRGGVEGFRGGRGGGRGRGGPRGGQGQGQAQS